MQNYTNKTCGQCGEQFKEGDDIAVCPYCGTPVHRSCWTGHCPNEDKHESGYDWNKEAEKASENNSTSSFSDSKVCSICKQPIDERSVYCPDCGAPMHMKCYLQNRGCPNAANHDGSYYDESNLDNADGTPKIFVDSFGSFADKVKKHPVIDRETGEPMTCRGVTQAELVHFLGKDYITTPRYMSLFMRMDKTGKKLAFNLWQGLLMPYYQFYQRMTGPAILLLVLTFILNIPQDFLTLQVEASLLSNGASKSFFALWSASNAAVTDAMMTSPLAPIISVLSYVLLAIQIIMALFGDYFYMRWTTNRILSLRQQYSDLPEEEYYRILEKKGNPKWYYTLIGIFISLILSYSFTFAVM